MLKINGKDVYIDIDKMYEKCKTGIQRLDSETNTFIDEISLIKYEILKICAERLLNDYTENENIDVIIDANDFSPSFRIAYNTLLNNDILVENDDYE